MFGFIIAAPGAVMIRGFLTRERNGKISLAGPLTNIILAIIFLIPMLLIKSEGILGLFFSYGLTINSLLAVFNLIPVPPFDGYKVRQWNNGIYIASVVVAILLFLTTFFI